MKTFRLYAGFRLMALRHSRHCCNPCFIPRTIPL